MRAFLKPSVYMLLLVVLPFVLALIADAICLGVQLIEVHLCVARVFLPDHGN